MKIYKLEYDENENFLEPGTLFFSSYKKMRKWVNQKYGRRMDSLSIHCSAWDVPKTKEALIHWLNVQFQDPNA